MRLLLLAALLTAASPQQTAPPAAPQTFRSGAQIVEVDVRVLGKDGKFVTDLGLDDFEITEDGVPQKVQSVVLIARDSAPSAPVAPVAPAPLEPSAPLAPLAPRASAQIWVFVFDTAHLAPGRTFRPQTSCVEALDRRVADLILREARIEDDDIGVRIAGRLFSGPIARGLRGGGD